MMVGPEYDAVKWIDRLIALQIQLRLLAPHEQAQAAVIHDSMRTVRGQMVLALRELAGKPMPKGSTGKPGRKTDVCDDIDM